MRLGIFGGTFDPVHHGHLIVGEYVREAAGLDRIVFIPAMISPHKQSATITPSLHRLAMLREAVKPNPFFEVSDLEIERGGISFTVDTLRVLRALHPRDEHYLLIGADTLRDFAAWKDPGEILTLARLIVMSRPGFPGVASDISLPADIIHCQVPSIDISATEIRRRVQGGLPISYLVPASVARYIGRHRLYRGA